MYAICLVCLPRKTSIPLLLFFVEKRTLNRHQIWKQSKLIQQSKIKPFAHHIRWQIHNMAEHAPELQPRMSFAVASRLHKTTHSIKMYATESMGFGRSKHRHCVSHTFGIVAPFRIYIINTIMGRITSNERKKTSAQLTFRQSQTDLRVRVAFGLAQQNYAFLLLFECTLSLAHKQCRIICCFLCVFFSLPSAC